MNTFNEKFYRALVEHSADPILVLGPDLRVFFSTLKDMAAIGLPGVDPIGTALQDYAAVEYRAEMAVWLDRIIADPQRAHRFEFECQQRIKGGWHLVAIANNLRRDPAVASTGLMLLPSLQIFMMVMAMRIIMQQMIRMGMVNGIRMKICRI